MSGNDNIINAVALDRDANLLEKKTLTEAERLSKLVNLSLNHGTLSKTHLHSIENSKVISSGKPIAQELAWIEEECDEELQAFLSVHSDEVSWEILINHRSSALLEQARILYNLLDHQHNKDELFREIIARLDKTYPIVMLGIYCHSLNLGSFSINIEHIDIIKDFNIYLDNVQKSMEIFSENYQSSHPHSLNDALSIELPFVIARILLLDNGTLNFGLIPLVNERLNVGSNNFNKTLSNRLDRLYSDKMARNALSAIRAPVEKNSATQLLQILNQLPEGASVTHKHAQEAALAAYLTHMRQIPPNGCFAMVVCQSQLESNPCECFEDFRNLLSKGVLKRKINKVIKEFPFLLATPPMYLDTELKIYGNQLLNSPAIESICSVMGIENFRKDISELQPPLTPRALIRQLAGEDEGKIKRGCLAFDFQTRNGLLIMWHNAVAGMAEGKPSSMIKNEIVKAVLRAIQADYQGLDDAHLYLKERLENNIIAHLQEHMVLLFDPEIQHPVTGAGGFVLYDKDHPLTRIDTSSAFQKWMAMVLEEACLDLMKHASTKDNSKLLRKMIKGLMDCISTETFIDRVLFKYMDQEHKEASRHLDSIIHTPWITRTGDDTQATLNVYYPQGEFLKSKKINPINPEDLLNELKEFYESRRRASKPIPRFAPARLEGLHAFNLIPLPEKFEKLSKRREKFQVGKTYQERMIHRIMKQFYLDVLELGVQEKKSLYLFRNQIIDALNKASPVDEKEKRSRERIIDTLIINKLSARKRLKILSQSIPIADTNWSIDNRDIYFYCLFNPFSEKIELWKMGSDLSHASATNPDVWLKNQTWEIFYL